MISLQNKMILFLFGLGPIFAAKAVFYWNEDNNKLIGYANFNPRETFNTDCTSTEIKKQRY